MSCNVSCNSVAKVKKTYKPVECALKEHHIDERVEATFRDHVDHYRKEMTVNIDYANEYLTRGRESDLGTLAFFIVDDLLDTLNLDATKTIFEAESGFKLKKIKDADTIRLMYHLAENVKLLDTVAEKTVSWFTRKQDRAMCNLDMDEIIWTIWDKLNLSEYIRMYKEMYECMPGDESRQFYETTSLHSLLHHCNPDRTAQVIEYTVSSGDPVPICSNTDGECRNGSSKRISSGALRKAVQNSSYRRSNTCSRR